MYHDLTLKLHLFGLDGPRVVFVTWPKLDARQSAFLSYLSVARPSQRLNKPLKYWQGPEQGRIYLGMLTMQHNIHIRKT